MSWLTELPSSRGALRSTRWRRIGVALLMGLALTIAACGSTTGVGAPPTPTPKPTATATPVACTTWRIIPSPNVSGYSYSDLRAVSALSSTQAWAVGGGMDTTPSTPVRQSLVEQWDGTAWHIVASAGYDGLYGVTAISPRDVWAVGGSLNYGVGGPTPQPERPLIMHWNGTTWSVVPGVLPADANAVSLTSVAAVGAKDVWAVGYQDAGSAHLYQPLVERWDGTAWHLVTPPMPQGATNGTLSTVARIPGTNQFWAVGGWSKYSVPSLPQPLLERWNGTTWQLATSPALPSGAIGGSWSGVVALSATNAWAVGNYYVRNPVDRHPLISHWDGTRWTIVASPNAFGELNSVAAAGATDVRVAGSLLTGSDASNGNGRRVPLIEQWNGAAWQIATTPDLPSGAQLSGPLSIATDGAGTYWAVGSYLNASSVYSSQTLTLHCP